MNHLHQDRGRYMRRCVELAEIARARGSTPVGSLVVRNGQIIGEGIEQSPLGLVLTGHAELLACQQAVETIGARVLRGATLYTTSEPCFMCSYVIRQVGIAEVVYGHDTPTIGGVTSAFPVLTSTELDSWRPAVLAIGGMLRGDRRE